MQINNPLQMNDWEIKKFLKVTLAIQLAMWGVISLDFVGLQIPILRQLIGFIYLTFVPGILILRILKLHKLGNIETLLYTVGLSIATLMFTGFFMNMIYPLFGISGPISITPLIITISAVVLILCVLSYVRDKDFSNPNFIDIEEILSPPALFLCLIPFLAIFGTYLVNFHNNNFLLLVLLAVIATLPLITLKSKKVSNRMYPLVLLVISLSLLMHNSLVSSYIQGPETHSEYYIANLVLRGSVWDSTLRIALNALLSLVVLAPMYSIVLGMELTWVFKIIYPLFFSLVPLSLYRTFLKQTNSEIGYLSSAMFMFCFSFYFELLATSRQQMATLFTTLVILLICDKNLKRAGRKVLIILFSIALIVSHYATSYFLGFFLVSSLFVSYLLNILKQRYSYDSFDKGDTINYNFVLFYLVVVLAWYIYTVESSFFIKFANLSNHIINSILTSFFQTESSHSFATLTSVSASPLHQITKYMHILIQIFITLGVLSILANIFSKEKKYYFSVEYIAISLSVFLFLGATLLVPYFNLATSRFYHFALIFLAPFCLIGFEEIYMIVKKNLFRITDRKVEIKRMITLFGIFLIPFLLFNSGFVYELAKSYPISPSLSQNAIHHESLEEKYNFYRNYYTAPEQDVICIKWITKNCRFTDHVIYFGGLSCRPFTSYGMGGSIRGWHGDRDRTKRLTNSTKTFKHNSYIYITYVNTKENLMSERLTSKGPSVIYEYDDFKQNLAGESKIYSNGASLIYHNP